MAKKDERIMTDEALQMLGCSYKTLYRKIVDKTIRAEKRGRDCFFKEDEVNVLKGQINGRTKYPDTKPKKIERQKIL